MNILLFVFTIVVSFIIVRIGAILFQLTGLEWSQAKFQALSCFSGTGFTTRESESVTALPQRRRIASFLIILGNAGLVTLIATFANSLNPDSFMNRLIPSFLPASIPARYSPWMNLLLIVLVLFVLYKLLTNTRITDFITEKLKTHIQKRQLSRMVSFEELLIATGGYGVSQVDLPPESRLIEKTIMESDLRTHDILVLAIERKGQMIANPPPAMKFLAGDKLVCFGKLETIRKEVYPEEA